MKRRILAVGVAGVLLATACSSSGGSGGGGNSSSAGGPTGSASGAPIKVFFFDEEGASAAASSPESWQAAQAAADYINKDLGGVKGRPITLTHCATLGTADSVTNCANKAVDAKPDVVVKGVEVNSETAVPIITSAGIPYITQNAGAPAETATKGAFVFSSGFSALLAPPVPYAQQHGYKSIGVIYTNVAALATAVGTVSKLAQKDGVGVITDPVAITTADMTPAYSSLLAKHVGAIYVITSAAQCASALKARASLSDNTPLIMASACNDPTVIKAAAPSAVNGMLVTLPDTSAVTSDKDTQAYLKAMKQYSPSANTGSFAPSSFATLMNLYNALSTVSDPSTLNAATITSTLEATKNVPLFMGGGKTFSCDGSVFPQQPSVCTGASFLVTYDNGSYQLAGAYDASTLLAGLS